ncbi:hypothetical protein PRZ48_007034 [Zasmidium cellare]|uniref:Uncharacterized protein n=1 Tax=Zasmidium cellare TaxID=395010 RepID=A0ABR0EI85_ZASCE|nr:hypothetical protein PRZ48_007034 [Zasmidium cellare]
MKFFALATAVLPVAMAAVYRAAPVQARDISLTIDASEALDVLTDLIKTVCDMEPGKKEEGLEAENVADTPGNRLESEAPVHCLWA